MSWSLSTLAAYTKDNAEKLYTSAIVDAPTAALIAREGILLTGVKTAERIPTLTTDAVLQDGSTCGFNASGTTEISQRTVTVGAIKVQEEFCLIDLEAKFTQLMMQKGSLPEEMPGPIEAAFVEQKNNKIADKMEKALWKGDTLLTGNTDLKWFDGFIKIIDDATGVANANAMSGTGTITATTGAATVAGVGTAFTTEVAVGDKIYSNGVLIGTVLSIASATALTLAANGAAAVTGASFNIVASGNSTFAAPITGALTTTNILAAVDSLVMAIPQSVLDSTEPTYLFMGTDAARAYVIALKNANLYHFAPSANDLREGFYVPGLPLNIKVMPTPGLTGTNRMFVIQAKNMVLGTDLENEWEQYKMWFSDDDDKLKFYARWKEGVQIVFPSEVAQYAAA